MNLYKHKHKHKIERLCLYDYGVIIRSFVIMSTSDFVVGIENVSVSLLSQDYWPLTQEAVRDCDLTYIKDKWSADMIRDGMHAIILVNALPEVNTKEINVWQYLAEYSPPEDRGFMFSMGDDRIVSLVQNKMTVGHSGYSMGWTMRHIEFIAKNGIPAHREMIRAYPGRANCY